MAKKKRTIVGSPLTPQMLFQLGATSGFSPDEKPFNPAGEWTNRYTIWICHGYRESGNLDVGFLQIQRGLTGSDKRFELQVHQDIRNEEGSLNRIVAKIDCIEGDISYPVKWHYTSVFLNAEGQEDKRLSVNVEGQYSPSAIRRTKNGILSTTAYTRRPSCDWCVYETVQRRAKHFTDSLTFDMLEGLELFKPGQQLIDRGEINVKVGSSDHRLHRFDQMGAGILPFEYWVDESFRLRLMISMDKAYILDNQFGPDSKSGQKENTKIKGKGKSK